jgi:hypothetical protein
LIAAEFISCLFTGLAAGEQSWGMAAKCTKKDSLKSGQKISSWHAPLSATSVKKLKTRDELSKPSVRGCFQGVEMNGPFKKG